MPDDLRSQIRVVKRVFRSAPAASPRVDRASRRRRARHIGRPDAERAGGDGAGHRRQGHAPAVGPAVRVLSRTCAASRSGSTTTPSPPSGASLPSRFPICSPSWATASTISPACRGPAEKTAVKLISQFGSVERLYENLTLVQGKCGDASPPFASRHSSARAGHGEHARAHRAGPRSLQAPGAGLGALRRSGLSSSSRRCCASFPPRRRPWRHRNRCRASRPQRYAMAGRSARRRSRGGGLGGEGGPPGPALTALGVYHPAAGAAILRLEPERLISAAGRSWAMTSSPSSSGGLARGTPPRFRRQPPSALPSQFARTSYKLDEGQRGAPRRGARLATAGSRARWVWQIWEMLPARPQGGESPHPVRRSRAAARARAGGHGSATGSAWIRRASRTSQGARPDPGAAHP